jgi:hypothetical protein
MPYVSYTLRYSLEPTAPDPVTFPVWHNSVSDLWYQWNGAVWVPLAAGWLPVGPNHAIGGFASAAGVSGVDNTAMTLQTITLPFEEMTAIGDRLVVHAFFRGDTGGPITATVRLNGVPISSGSVSGTNWLVIESRVNYLTPTTAQITDGGSGTGSLTSNNVSGFNWAADQPLTFSQGKTANQRLTLYSFNVNIEPAVHD